MEVLRICVPFMWIDVVAPFTVHAARVGVPNVSALDVALYPELLRSTRNVFDPVLYPSGIIELGFW